MNQIIIVNLLFGCFLITICDLVDAASEVPENEISKDKSIIGRELVEEGRTLVHHAVKRFMIILPAIFFKLGVAFTLLILVTLVAVNNGFIGFLLLIVGLSSVLARLQESKRPALSVPYISHLPPYHRHIWDRSDSSAINEEPTEAAKLAYNGYVLGSNVGQNQQYYTSSNSYNPSLSTYYASYVPANSKA